MCTLIVLDRIVPGYPLVVASNRDEFYARPAAPPARAEVSGPGAAAAAGEPPFVAPQDLEAGGTWMGLNAKGVFVGLTNRRPAGDGTSRTEQRRSRGLLVRDALRRASAEEVADQMDGEAARVRYDPFHLLVADGRRAFLFVESERGRQARPLEPGRHVVCNRDADDPSSGKVRAIERAVNGLPLDRGPSTLLAGLADVLGAHPDPSNPLENPCVHTPEYGTRSSSLIAVGERRWRFWHAEGPPCETKYSNLTRLLDEIREGSDPAGAPRSFHAHEDRRK